MAAITICSDFLTAPPKKCLSLFPLFPHLFAMKWWDQMPWSLFPQCWVLSQHFYFYSPLSLSSRSSLVLLHFLSKGWCHGSQKGGVILLQRGSLQPALTLVLVRVLPLPTGSPHSGFAQPWLPLSSEFPLSTSSPLSIWQLNFRSQPLFASLPLSSSFSSSLINCGESPLDLGPEFGSCCNLTWVSTMLAPGNDLQPGMWYSSVSLTKPGIVTAMKICLVSY